MGKKKFHKGAGDSGSQAPPPQQQQPSPAATPAGAQPSRSADSQSAAGSGRDGGVEGQQHQQFYGRGGGRGQRHQGQPRQQQHREEQQFAAASSAQQEQPSAASTPSGAQPSRSADSQLAAGSGRDGGVEGQQHQQFYGRGRGQRHQGQPRQQQHREEQQFAADSTVEGQQHQQFYGRGGGRGQRHQGKPKQQQHREEQQFAAASSAQQQQQFYGRGERQEGQQELSTLPGHLQQTLQFTEQNISPQVQQPQQFVRPQGQPMGQQHFEQQITSQVEKPHQQSERGRGSQQQRGKPSDQNHQNEPQEQIPSQVQPHQQPTRGKGQSKGQQRHQQPQERKAQPQPHQQPASGGPLKPAGSRDLSLAFIQPQRQKLSSAGTKGRKILIETNHLALQFKNLGTAIHYDIAIDPDKPKKMMRMVVEQFRRDNYPNRHPAFDGVKNLYSASLLPFGHETSGEVKVMENDREKTFKIKIKYAAEIDLSALSRYFGSLSTGNVHMVTPQEAIQCIDIVLRNAPSMNCIPVGRSFFTKPRDRILDLGEGMEMYYGFYQSAILGWKPFLNVDVAHKAFPKAIPLLDLLQELCYQYDIRSPLERNNFEVVDKFLKTLKVVYQIPNQPATRRVMSVNGLDRPASQARFKNERNVEMTVADYFARVKNVKLNYPHLPCLWVGSRQREPRILLPLEFCTLAEGQATNRSMTAGQTSAMIKIAATSTGERKNKIMQTINNAKYSTDPCAKEFNIGVNTEFTKIQARVLDAPPLQYSNNRVQPRKGVWRAEKFQNAETLSNWCILCVDDRTRPQVIQEFAVNMVKEGRVLGMNIEPPEILPILRLMRGREKQKLEEEFGKLKKNSLILVVIPEFPKEWYAYVKQAAELSVGVVTQCVKSKNVFKKQPSTLSNILLKVNAKLNGRNHTLANLPPCLRRPCMIMGADVTHPSPESRGQVPSVAAVTASHDPYAFKYNITWRLQPSTQEIILDLENIVREHLLFFKKMTKAKPERIIFFRDGVSEGQFEVVVQAEVQAVRRACLSLEPSGDYKPKVTFLVVQKRHHTRFFPTNPRDSEDRNCNVPAGTIVDTDITHPTALDFYLVSHASIQGVARPTKYRKLWDDDDMQEDELEELTYHLCHLFTRCTRSVSYPAPTYYAHLAAARAKVYTERRQINLNNLDREQSQLQIKEEITKGFPMFFV